jgi:hypothetical protein
MARDIARSWIAVMVAAMVLWGGPSAGAQEVLPQDVTEVIQDLGKVVDAVTSPPNSPGSAGSGTDGVGQSEEGSSAGGAVLSVGVAGRPVATVGQTGTQASPGGATGHATLLALAGHEVIGARARDGSSGATLASLEGLCRETDGQVCAGLLFADAAASEDDASSSAQARTAVAFACIGGGEIRYGPSCSGPITVSLVTSESFASWSGSQSGASQQTELARACLLGENAAGVCDGIGVTLLHAESSATATGQTASGEGDSYLLAVDLAGDRTTVGSDEEEAAVPPGCPPGGSLACVNINRGDSAAVPGSAESEQETVRAALLPGIVDDADLFLAFSPTAGTSSGTPAPAVTVTGPREVGASGEGSAGGEDGAGDPAGGVKAGGASGSSTVGDGLAFTGSDIAGLVGLTLLLLALGIVFLALHRRRIAVH